MCPYQRALGLAQQHTRSPLPCTGNLVLRRRAPTACAAAQLRTSLIPQTLEELEHDNEGRALAERLASEGQAALTREERRARQRSLDALGVPPFLAVAREHGVTPLRRGEAAVLQLNIGLYCNQACSHCHVESSPLRTEAMDATTAARCIELLRSGRAGVHTVDLTGGAPEINPQFRYLVREARALGLEVIDRCNLTVLQEPGQEDLPAFLADHQVRVVASLPCYTPSNVDAQRGGGVFQRSIAGLRALNAVGYGRPGSALELDLVYNPGGPFLAPDQATLEASYRVELREAFGIEFSRLLCLNNMPIKRYVDFLLRRGQLQEYMQLLVKSFNPAAAEGVMCRDTVSVGWDGRVYDCDFNQQLALGLRLPGRAAGPLTVFDVASLDELTGAPIVCDNHCFGCTAGAGFGCQGAPEAATN
ncbi:hypothetical protein WJX81_003051 [Elliptochloris bilobata]|uniref:Fe-S oxidoreductase n=1 Tax=Elliptochloris bilobata TaxID=381761 RepID=A0AAW1SF34_9CHLO